MSNLWPRVKLGKVLKRSVETIVLQPDAEYREITVKLWGKGVILRGVVSGSATSGGQRFLAKSGQFIMSRIDARNGASGIVPLELDGAVVTNDFPVFDVNATDLDAGFFGWLSKTKDFVDLCRKASEGTTNRVRLQEDRFLGFEISLPSLSEQRRIVARIEDLATKIREAKDLRYQTDEETKLVYSRCLDVIMTPHGEGWNREIVADVIQSIDAGWSPQCDDIPATENQWGVLKTTAVQWCEFQPYQNKALPIALQPCAGLALKEGDVLVTRAGPRKRVGVVAAVRRDEPRLMISDKIIRLRTNRKKIEPRFFELSLASPFSQEHFVQRKTGLADAQVNISQDILKSTPISYPSLCEQRCIVAELDALQAKVDELKALQIKTSTELDALLPSVLDRAFKGEL